MQTIAAFSLSRMCGLNLQAYMPVYAYTYMVNGNMVGQQINLLSTHFAIEVRIFAPKSFLQIVLWIGYTIDLTNLNLVLTFWMFLVRRSVRQSVHNGH
jgi:hypothetical protein